MIKNEIKKILVSTSSIQPFNNRTCMYNIDVSTRRLIQKLATPLKRQEKSLRNTLNTMKWLKTTTLRCCFSTASHIINRKPRNKVVLIYNITNLTFLSSVTYFLSLVRCSKLPTLLVIIKSRMTLSILVCSSLLFIKRGISLLTGFFFIKATCLFVIFISYNIDDHCIGQIQSQI